MLGAHEFLSLSDHLTLELNAWSIYLTLATHQVFSSGGVRLDGRTVSHHTVVLLISQSGQTFATLHATRLMTNLLRDNVFLLVGSSSTKMEQAMKQVRAHTNPCPRCLVFVTSCTLVCHS